MGSLMGSGRSGCPSTRNDGNRVQGALSLGACEQGSGWGERRFTSASPGDVLSHPGSRGNLASQLKVSKVKSTRNVSQAVERG